MADRMKRQDTAGQLGDLQERADHLAERQKEVENQLRQSYAGNSKDGKGGNGLNRQQSEQVASELDKNLEDLKKLEQDIQRSARDLRATQPDASTQVCGTAWARSSRMTWSAACSIRPNTSATAAAIR